MEKWFRAQWLVLLIGLSITPLSVAETLLELGPSQVGSTYSAGGMLTLTERWDRYEATLGYITEQEFDRCERPDCTWFVEEQIFFGVERRFDVPWVERLSVSIGPYYFAQPDRVGTSRFRIGLGVEYRFNDYIGLRSRHFSLAGSGDHMEFCRERWGCMEAQYNVGQDSWLRLVVYF